MAATTDHDEQTAGAPVSPSQARARGPVGKLATAVSLFGELLITAGLVLGLFVAYSLWWTNVVADREANKQGDEVRDHWADADTGPGALDTKDGIGFLHVPAMRNGEVLVKKGTSSKVLNNGVAGYYVDPVKSALPQAKQGNFTLAAHRDGHGAKFHNIDKLKKGDPIVFETKNDWYVYKVYDDPSGDLEVQRPGPVRDPEGIGEAETRPLHHADDLHAGVHVGVPVHRVGGAGAGGEGGLGADGAGGVAVT